MRVIMLMVYSGALILIIFIMYHHLGSLDLLLSYYNKCILCYTRIQSVKHNSSPIIINVYFVILGYSVLT